MLRVLSVGVFPDAARYGIPPGMQLYRLDLAKTYKLDTDGVTWIEIVSGGGAAPSVQEADGAPSVASIVTLVFDQADGFVVTDLGGNIARVDLSAVPQSAVSGLATALDEATCLGMFGVMSGGGGGY